MKGTSAPSPSKNAVAYLIREQSGLFAYCDEPGQYVRIGKAMVEVHGNFDVRRTLIDDQARSCHGTGRRPVAWKGMVQGIKAGGFIFFSAIRGNHPVTNYESSDTKEQAR